MALQQDLEQNVKRIFNRYSASTISIPNNKGNLYELYLFLLTFKTLKSINSTTQINGPASNFVFRCSPGKIFNSRFSYITFKKNNQVYELRNGIEVQGYNMYHETDISIFKNAQLDNTRPNKLDLLFTVECKNHSILTSLKGEVRKYLGGITDLAHGNHNGNAGCVHCGIGFEAIFSTPLNAVSNQEYCTYLQNYGLNSAFGLKPNSRQEKIYKKRIKHLHLSL